MQPPPPKPVSARDGVLIVVALLPFLGSIPVALVVAIAEWFPTSRFIELQLLWMDGYYYTKLTFLLTWFAFISLFAIPAELLTGVVQLYRGIVRTNPDVSSATSQTAYLKRFARLVFGAGLGVFSLAYLVLVAVRPDMVDALGMFAAFVLLAAMPFVPLGLLLVIDAICPSEVVDGVVEAHLSEGSRSGAITKLRIAGQEIMVPPAIFSATPDGVRVRLVLSGYIGGFLALERVS